MRFRFSLLIAVVPALLACASQRPSVASAAGATTPDAVPVLDAAGRGATLSSVLGGRPGLVNLWAPWCEPCVRELPALERLSRAVAPCGGAVVGVAVGEKPESIAAFARTRALTYPQLTDEPFTLADALGQRRIPATLVFDRAGHVVYAGDALDARATQALSRTLAETAPATKQSKKGCDLP
jgi:thiol-disulfide isomerase/thioredoxin